MISELLRKSLEEGWSAANEKMQAHEQLTGTVIADCPDQGTATLIAALPLLVKQLQEALEEDAAHFDCCLKPAIHRTLRKAGLED